MQFRNLVTCASFAPAILLSIAACRDGQGETDKPRAQSQMQVERNASDSVSGASAGNTAGTDGADDRPRREMTESDRLSVEMASSACKSNDFRGFFAAFSRSWAVRERYTAGRVDFGSEGSSRPMQRRQYLDQNNFPISPMDMSYVTAESARMFESNDETSWKKLVFVELEFGTAADNRRRVDWVAGMFERNLDPSPEYLEEGLGKLVKAKSRGYVLFKPTETCWELTQDVLTQPWQD